MTAASAQDSIRIDGGGAFLCRKFGVDNPILAVRMAVRQLLSAVEHPESIDLDALLTVRRVAISDCPPAVEREALLVPTIAGFELFIRGRRSASDPPRRFTKAHELIETFFFEERDGRRIHWSRLPEWRMQATQAALGPAGNEERLCDYGAGLLLVSTQVMDDFTDMGACLPQYRDFVKLRRRLGVSEIVLAHRLANYYRVRLNTATCVLFAGRDRHRASSHAKASDWRLIPNIHNASAGTDITTTLATGLFIPLNKHLASLGFSQSIHWLSAMKDTPPPVGDAGYLTYRKRVFELSVLDATYDDVMHVAVLRTGVRCL